MSARVLQFRQPPSRRAETSRGQLEDRGVYIASHLTAAGEPVRYAVDSRGREIARVPTRDGPGVPDAEAITHALWTLLDAVDPECAQP